MATKNAPVVQIPSLKLATFQLKIVGDSPLICHAWSQKAKLQMANNQLQKAKTGKEVRRPAAEFAESLYWLSEKPDFDGLPDEQVEEILADIIPKSKFGFPVTAFKSAALDAGYQQGVLAAKAGTAALAKTTARGAIHIKDEFAVIDGTPTPREDMVRVGTGTDLRYRAEFKSWRTELTITYNTSSISVEQIVNLFRLSGYAIGVGDWRPAKDGPFGTFHVE